MGFGLLELGSAVVYLFLLAMFFLLYLFTLSDISNAEQEERWREGRIGRTWQYAITGTLLSVLPCWLVQGYSTTKFFFDDGPGQEFSFTFTAIFAYWAAAFLVSAFWVRNVRHASRGTPSRTLAYFLFLSCWFAWGFDPVNEAFLRFYSV